MTGADGFRVDTDRLDIHARQVRELAEAVEVARPRWDDISPDAYGTVGVIFAGAVVVPMTLGVIDLDTRARRLGELAKRLRAARGDYLRVEKKITEELAGVEVPSVAPRAGG